MTQQADVTHSPAQQALLDIWQQHIMAEFVLRDTEAALATMTEDAHVLMVPIMMGGYGKAGVRAFYSTSFIPQIPPGFEATPVSQTVAEDCIVEEAVYRFTHDQQIDFILPGIPPTGKAVEVGVIGVVRFRDGKVLSEHLYWDQATVLRQIGLLDPATPAVVGPESARALLDPTLLPHGSV